MATLRAFNELMDSFLQELQRTYKREESLRVVHRGFTMARDANARAPLESFMREIAPFMETIAKRDEDFFLKNAHSVSLLKKCNFEANWRRSPQKTKDAIWEYLSTLVFLGSSLIQIDDGALQKVEEFALEFVNEMSEKPGGPGLEGLEGLEALDMDNLIARVEKDLLPKFAAEK